MKAQVIWRHNHLDRMKRNRFAWTSKREAPNELADKLKKLMDRQGAIVDFI